MEINYELKDRVLEILCKNFELQKFHRINPTAFKKNFNISFNELNIILPQFQDMGLIYDLTLHPSEIRLIIKLEAKEFVEKGGFKFRDELLRLNFEKLLLEIESLKPSMPDKVAKITTIIANISTALGIILSK